jgi:hypothetical protein
MSNARKGKSDDQYTEEETARRRDDAIRSGVTIRIRYRILNARLAAGAVSSGGVDQACDGWRVVSQFEFQQWVEAVL